MCVCAHAMYSIPTVCTIKYYWLIHYFIRSDINPLQGANDGESLTIIIYRTVCVLYNFTPY